MPRAKKPARILPDTENVAIRMAAMFELQKGSYALVQFSIKEIEDMVAGIRSLAAERDARRKELAALRKLREVVSGMPQVILPDTVRAALSDAVRCKQPE